jgi:hypothetical protein
MPNLHPSHSLTQERSLPPPKYTHGTLSLQVRGRFEHRPVVELQVRYWYFFSRQPRLTGITFPNRWPQATP